ncbi:MAG: hypothetical protein AAF587_24360 [Bacteroidota bacterium]
MSRNQFFFILHLLLLAVVLLGFAPSFYLRPFGEQNPLPVYLILHGIACTAWFLLAVLQSSLIQSRRLPLHKRLGTVGSLLGPFVALTGFWVMWHRIQAYYSMDGRQGEELLQAQLFESMLIWGDILVLLSFPCIIYLAYRSRFRIEAHKRWVLFGSVMIVPQAFVRLGKFPFLQIGEDAGVSGSLYAVAGPMTILLSLLIYDLWHYRRPQRTTSIAFVWYFILLLSAMIIMRSGIGVSILELMR